MTAESIALATEATPEGEQTLVPGVAPISPRERLEAEMRAGAAPAATRAATYDDRPLRRERSPPAAPF